MSLLCKTDRQANTYIYNHKESYTKKYIYVCYAKLNKLTNIIVVVCYWCDYLLFVVSIL